MNPRMLCCTGLLLIAGPALSAELEYALRGGVTYSDNIERVSDGLERSTAAAVAGVELSGERETGRLRYDISADVTYHEYLSLGLDSEVFGHAAMLGSYEFVPDSFDWNASIAYEEIRADIFRPLAPGNTEALLSFSTGPTLRASFSEVMEGQLDGQYARTSYGDRPFDNQTVGARALLARRTNPRSLLALGASYDDVSYVSGGAPAGLDFVRQELFVRLELAGVRTDIELETGYSDINGESFDGNGPMLRARLSRRMTPALTGFIGAVREYPTSEDTARSADALNTAGGEYDRSELTSGPRQSTGVQLGLRFERPRVNAELTYELRDEESLVGTAAERTRHALHGSVGRRFAPRVRGTLFGTLTNEDVPGPGGNVDEWTLGAELALSFGRSLDIDLRVEQRDREGLSALDDYSELSGGIFLRYSGPSGADTAR
jgi:hypothetical protein